MHQHPVLRVVVPLVAWQWMLQPRHGLVLRAVAEPVEPHDDAPDVDGGGRLERVNRDWEVGDGRERPGDVGERQVCHGVVRGAEEHGRVLGVRELVRAAELVGHCFVRGG